MNGGLGLFFVAAIAAGQERTRQNQEKRERENRAIEGRLREAKERVEQSVAKIQEHLHPSRGGGGGGSSTMYADPYSREELNHPFAQMFTKEFGAVLTTVNPEEHKDKWYDEEQDRCIGGGDITTFNRAFFKYRTAMDQSADILARSVILYLMKTPPDAKGLILPSIHFRYSAYSGGNSRVANKHISSGYAQTEFLPMEELLHAIAQYPAMDQYVTAPLLDQWISAQADTAKKKNQRAAAPADRFRHGYELEPRNRREHLALENGTYLLAAIAARRYGIAPTRKASELLTQVSAIQRKESVSLAPPDKSAPVVDGHSEVREQFERMHAQKRDGVVSVAEHITSLGSGPIVPRFF